jgi:2-(1,2-epoxy-1,2-dihydrophenyl)acetyl-CoA isomerase
MGNKVKATEALNLGIINKVVPANQLDIVVNDLSAYFAKAPTKAVGIIKKMLNKSITSTLEEQLELEAYSQETAGSSADHQEGVKAFLEKRKPEFAGK